MPHGDLSVERRERQRESSGGVAVHEHCVGRRELQHGGRDRQNARREPVERLTVAHEVQVMIDAQVERSRRLVEHLAVLSRRERLDLERLVGFERVQNRRHLNRFRARAECDEHALPALHASLRFLAAPRRRKGRHMPALLVRIPLCKTSDERNASQHA